MFRKVFRTRGAATFGGTFTSLGGAFSLLASQRFVFAIGQKTDITAAETIVRGLICRG